MSHNKHYKATTSVWLSLVAVLFAGTDTANAQQWSFDASADIGFIYTDNLFLAEDDAAESELVYSVIPTLTLTSEGERLFGRIQYRPEAYLYAGSSEFNDIRNVLDANMTLAAVPEAFYLFASAAQFQSLRALEGEFPNTNVAITQNRVDSQVFEIRPYWEQSFSFGDVYAQYSIVDLGFDGDTLNGQEIQDVQAQDVQFRFSNASRQQGLAWGVDYIDQTIDYDQGFEFRFQRFTANVGYWIGDTLRAFVSGGLETPLGGFPDGGLEDDFYEVGFQYVPNARLDLTAAVARRSFGNALRLNGSYRLRRGTTRLTYSEEPQARGQNIFGRQPLTDPNFIDNFGDVPGNDDTFILKRAEWSTSLELARTVVGLRLFDERRTNVSDVNGLQLGNEAFSGVELSADWTLGARTGLGLRIQQASREILQTEGDIFTIGLNANYNLSQRTAIVAGISRTEVEGQTLNGGDFTEQQARLSFRVSLR
ncbi:MAG: TIGR03016 family PEP-CTERM system-associated outer membrane protein [Pseudomonadota bacterium]